MSDHEASALQNPDALDVARRRGAAATAGHLGDEAAARRALTDEAPSVRATALAALVRLGCATVGDLATVLDDHDPAVRRRAAELACRLPGVDDPADEAVVLEVSALLLGRLVAGGDDEIEAACQSLGELQRDAAVPALAEVATSHHDPLCRESAVAALGAIGAPEGLSSILGAMSDKPAVRRRAVLALASYEGPDVDAALASALEDRDWQVRQAAEDLTGAR